MPNRGGRVIVTYDSIAPAVDRDTTEGVDLDAELANVPGSDVERAAFRAGFEQAKADLQRMKSTPGVLASTDARAVSLLQSYLAEEAALGQGKTTAEGPNHYEVRYDSMDLVGWGKSLFTWWRRWFDKHPYIAPSPAPDPIGADAFRVSLLGDWGTGLYGAPQCAATIQQNPTARDILVHLGDVYYSGMPNEVADYFLASWPRVSGAISRACNSNHEMYSGGNAYFRQTLPAFNQSSSAFALQSDDWLLVGLDTGYLCTDFEGGRVAVEQVAWLQGLINGAGNRRVVLFSHHQPFSFYDDQGPKLVEDLAPVLESGRVFAWYWGHEHRCVLYDRHPMWGLYGRCAGHSGFPYFRDTFAPDTRASTNSDGSAWHQRPAAGGAPQGIALDGPNQYVTDSPTDPNKYGPNGYLTLEFSKQGIREQVHAPNGTVLHDETLP